MRRAVDVLCAIVVVPLVLVLIVVVVPLWAFWKPDDVEQELRQGPFP